MNNSPALDEPVIRNEADALRARIHRRLTQRIATMVRSNFLSPEQATEVLAHIEAECGVAQPALKVAS